MKTVDGSPYSFFNSSSRSAMTSSSPAILALSRAVLPSLSLRETSAPCASRTSTAPTHSRFSNAACRALVRSVDVCASLDQGRQDPASRFGRARDGTRRDEKERPRGRVRQVRRIGAVAQEARHDVVVPPADHFREPAGDGASVAERRAVLVQRFCRAVEARVYRAGEGRGLDAGGVELGAVGCWLLCVREGGGAHEGEEAVQYFAARGIGAGAGVVSVDGEVQGEDVVFGRRFDVRAVLDEGSGTLLEGGDRLRRVTGSGPRCFGS